MSRCIMQQASRYSNYFTGIKASGVFFFLFYALVVTCISNTSCTNSHQPHIVASAHYAPAMEVLIFFSAAQMWRMSCAIVSKRFYSTYAIRLVAVAVHNLPLMRLPRIFSKKVSYIVPLYLWLIVFLCSQCFLHLLLLCMLSTSLL